MCNVFNDAGLPSIALVGHAPKGRSHSEAFFRESVDFKPSGMIMLGHLCRVIRNFIFDGADSCF